MSLKQKLHTTIFNNVNQISNYATMYAFTILNFLDKEGTYNCPFLYLFWSSYHNVSLMFYVLLKFVKKRRFFFQFYPFSLAYTTRQISESPDEINIGKDARTCIMPRYNRHAGIKHNGFSHWTEVTIV